MKHLKMLAIMLVSVLLALPIFPGCAPKADWFAIYVIKNVPFAYPPSPIPNPIELESEPIISTDEYELKLSGNKVIEQIIRPTGLIDPEIIVKPTEGQIEDLILQIKQRAKNNQRVLVTTLTKRSSEDLANYLTEQGIRVKYLHSEIQTIQRSVILKELREKKFDCLVGINLLREGLDLPEVSLVAILDADKEGFLRSATALIQVGGRAARNLNGTVIMYADTITKSMKKAIDESNRRRIKQTEFNLKYKITPRSIDKAIKKGIEDSEQIQEFVQELTGEPIEQYQLHKYISELEYEMEMAARNLQFEKAASFRDKIKELRNAINH